LTRLSGGVAGVPRDPDGVLLVVGIGHGSSQPRGIGMREGGMFPLGLRDQYLILTKAVGCGLRLVQRPWAAA